MIRRLVLAALILLVGSVCATAQSGTCSLKGASINFNYYIGNTLTASTTGGVTVHCSGLPGASYIVALDQGTAPGATTSSRAVTMRDQNGTHEFGYGLFQDASYSVPWGNSPRVDTETFNPGSGNNFTYYVYGQLLAANAYAPPGTYTDTVTVTIWDGTGANILGTGTLLVTVNVQTSCAVNASNLDFGAYTGAVANATSAVTVQCTNGTAYNVGFDPGQATGATVTTRQMMNGSKTLNYSLYSDSGRTKNWGNTVGADTLAGTGSGSVQTLTVYGQVPAGQTPVPGSYTDTITATLTY